MRNPSSLKIPRRPASKVVVDMDVSLMPLIAAAHAHLLAAPLKGIDPVQMIMLALAVGVLTVVMISTRNRIRRSQASSRESVRDRYTGLAGEGGAKRDLEAVMLELDQLSRQIHGRLDTKLARLETLIRDADDRIERLSRLQRAVEGESTIDVTLEPADPHCESAPLDDTSAPEAHDDVYRLADGGLSPMEIAGQLGRNRGEIELILSLRRAKGQPGYGEAVRRAAASPSR